MNLRPYLGTRWVVVPGAIGVAILAWLAYVETHNGGVIEGRVVDPAGRPVAGATVKLLERGFVTHNERAQTRSAPDGSFRFTENRSHSIQLEAEAPGAGRSERLVVRLAFQGQDARLAQPLVLPAVAK